MSISTAEGKIIGKAFLPVAGAGKAKSGQEVNIKLDSYSAERYGILRGQVSAISPIPLDGSYVLSVELENGLTTTHKKNLTFKAEMHGQAEIITEDIRLFQRIFYQLRKAFTQSTSSPTTKK